MRSIVTNDEARRLWGGKRSVIIVHTFFGIQYTEYSKHVSSIDERVSRTDNSDKNPKRQLLQNKYTLLLPLVNRPVIDYCGGRWNAAPKKKLQNQT